MKILYRWCIFALSEAANGYLLPSPPLSLSLCRCDAMRFYDMKQHEGRCVPAGTFGRSLICGVLASGLGFFLEPNETS